MKEIWEDIKDYEGLYQVSNYGRVKSIDKYVNTHYGKRFVKGIILKPLKTNMGYVRVQLCKGQYNRKYFSIHRLVAQAFILNPENKLEINHIDGDKLNNKVSNLEWCTRSENQLHAFKHGLQLPNKGNSGHISPFRRKINQYDLNNNYLKTWDSISEASMFYHGKTRSTIQDCLLNRQHTAYGYKWEYAD